MISFAADFMDVPFFIYTLTIRLNLRKIYCISVNKDAFFNHKASLFCFDGIIIRLRSYGLQSEFKNSG